MVYERPLRSDELMHFGVKGMKWGVRRYQNEDGTLTARGRMRYYGVGSSFTDSGRKKYKKDFRETYQHERINIHNDAAARSTEAFAKINNSKRFKNAGMSDYGENFETKIGQEYIKEINKTWRNLYTDAAKVRVGKNLLTNDYSYLLDEPLYTQYDRFIKR